MIRNFVHDVRHWGWRTAWWNLRVLLGVTFLPGNHHHVSVRQVLDEAECDKCR